MPRNEHHHLVPVIRTKLHLPAVPEGVVCRPRLHEIMDRGVHTSLTLVSAPAGYGKSLLVRHWAEELAEPIAWLSLDASDSDLRTFVTYFIAAIRTVVPDACPLAGSFAGATGFLSVPAVGSHLINEIDDLDEELVLVLDDYHLIEATSEVHDLVAFCLKHPPRNLHLVIVTRSDPPLPMTALRSNQVLAEVRLRDLQFTAEEIARFLDQVPQVTLSKEAVASLADQTEGWAVALQLISLHLAHVEDPEKFISELAGGVRHTRDYLLHEVLAVQTPALRECMLRASVLDRFDAGLLDAVCTPEDATENPRLSGREIIELLRANNLFSISLDAQAEWYRYHHLFQELLQKELRKNVAAEQVAKLHLRASRCFEDRGLMTEAITHAMAAGDQDYVTEIIAGHRNAALLADKWYMVEQWLEMLPREVRQQNPELLAAEAWTGLYRQQLAEVALLAEQAKALVQDDEEDADILAEVAFLEGYGRYWEGDAEQSIHLLEQSLAHWGDEECMCAAGCELHLAMARRMAGLGDLAVRSLEERLLRASGVEGVFPGYLLCGLAVLNLMAGNMHKAHAYGQRLMHAAGGGDLQNVRAWATYVEGIVLFHGGDFAGAAQHLGQTAELRYVMDALAAVDGLAGLALSLQLGGREDEADAVLDGSASFAEETNDPYLMGIADSARHRISVQRGDLSRALPWALAPAGAVSPFEVFLWLEVPALTRARVLIAANTADSLDKALALLAEVRQVSEDHHYGNATIEAAVLQAMALAGRKRGKKALAALDEALALAAPGGWMGPFLEAGPNMARLLQKRNREEGSDTFFDSLLAAVEIPGTVAPKAAARVAATADIHPQDELTNRERDVLDLLARRFHNKEIADRLCISAHTVNFHLKQIYQKLDAHNRRQAVDRARDLGMLADRAEG